MSNPQPITLTLDRRLFENPAALHIGRMRAAVWLYLDLLARLPPGNDTIEVEPVKLSEAMGLPEGTIRSWLGHLRKARYIEATRLNGSVRVRIRHSFVPGPPPGHSSPPRFFTVGKLARALGESGYDRALEDALSAHPDQLIQRALAGALAVPAGEIRRSRTALFLYLLKHHAQQPDNDPRP